MKRTFLYILLAVVVIGTGGYFFLSNSNGKDVKYRMEKVSRGDIVVQVRATGTINPVQTVQVGSQVSGTIQKLYVDYNSEVKKGQIVAQIDPTFLYTAVTQAEANVERSQAQVNDAKRTLARTTELFKKNLVSQADLDAATTNYESSTAQLKQAKAALDQQQVNLRYAIIRSPIDGVVISRDVDVGQTVAASLQAPKLFEIANDLKRMQVEASVDEADIGQVNVGQEVSFTVDAYPEEQFRGSVSQIRLAPVTVQNVVTYTVIIDVPNPDLKLRPGMTATVSILVDRRDNVLRISALALRFQPPQDVVEKVGTQSSTSQSSSTPDSQKTQQAGQQQGERKRWQGNGDSSKHRMGMMRGEGGVGWHRKQSKVWVLDENKNVKLILITAGLNDNRYVEVTGGELKEGDEVILSAMGPETASSQGSQQNPFQPRMSGGGGGRGR
ncbi:MAG: efflux RND transporter periplasmic adaptor subunit [Ignavibacteriae bacterium]|nr:efflux RND transporter periplasmic adaptor subunit [Ignavibacteria bacterium]MBI3365173.1 efflux RND transporter periplasmic adaptor subunit [Ignavibacteriota bacterium]